MHTRRLQRSPYLLPLYARAGAALLPGARHLPLVAGDGQEIPQIELCLTDVEIDPARLARYREVCAFGDGPALPVTYPHVLAFPLHMALMNDGRFPFGPVGLVHVQNTITAHRPVAASETLTLSVTAGPLRRHAKGRTFDLRTTVYAGSARVWESESTMLRRGAGSGERDSEQVITVPPGGETWQLADDLGRRYAAASGDRNPIHLHALTAKPFGFSRPIAHGMWSKARCLAALEESLPESCIVAVRFRRPILLPGAVRFSAAGRRDAKRFVLRAGTGDDLHLEGTVTA